LFVVISEVYAMRRFMCVLVALLITSTTLAVPAPEPFVTGWSKPVDPDRDCKIRRDKGALIIEMPGLDHDYDPHRERFNAPRIVREFKGNFDIQVRIQIMNRPSAQSTVKGQPSFISAGFLIIPPETFHTTSLRFEYGISREGFGFISRADRDCKKGEFNVRWDSRRKAWPLPKKSDHAYLRMEREGRRCSCSISPDGKDWTSLIGMGSLPEKLKLCLAAYTSSTEPSKVRFDHLNLSRGQRKKPLGGRLNFQARRP
jgi:hypothetical protein